MRLKQFFKSTAFRSIAVLLIIVILSGGLLAILHDLLFITNEERLARSLSKIYGEQAEVKEVLEVTAENSVYDWGTVEAGYLMQDGNYLVKSRGTGAYNGGTVTVWVVVEVKKNAVSGLGKVVFEDTSVGRFYAVSDTFYRAYRKYDGEVAQGKLFSVDKSEGIAMPYTGATASANAINHAVNTAIYFVKAVGLGETISAKYPFQRYINLAESSATVTGNSVTFTLAVKANSPAPAYTATVTVTDGAITAFAYSGEVASSPTYENQVEGSLKDGTFFLGKDKEDFSSYVDTDQKIDLSGTELVTGATLSNSNLIAPALFALYNYDLVLEEGGLQ